MQKGLGPHWKALVRRNRAGEMDADGLVWAAPYRWGCTLVAVRTDRLHRYAGRPSSCLYLQTGHSVCGVSSTFVAQLHTMRMPVPTCLAMMYSSQGELGT